jgi:DNA primase
MQSARHLLFYDTSSTLLDRDETRVMFISEGPRDALTPLQYGYASVCNLGADNSWSKHKINLILALRPDVLIMAFDGDDPGRQCAHAVYNDLSELVPTYDVVFPTVKVDGKNVKKYDLSDLSQDRVDGIVDDACAQYNLPIPRPYEWKRAVKSKWAV